METAVEVRPRRARRIQGTGLVPSLHGTGVRRYILVDMMIITVHHVVVLSGICSLPRAAARCGIDLRSRRSNHLSRISIVFRLAAPLWHQCGHSFLGNLIREPGRAPNISILPEERGQRCPRRIGQQAKGGGPTVVGFLGMCLPVLRALITLTHTPFPPSTGFGRHEHVPPGRDAMQQINPRATILSWFGLSWNLQLSVGQSQAECCPGRPMMATC